MYTYAVSAVRCFNRWGARELQSRSYAQCLCNFGAVWCVEQLCRLRQVVVKSRFAGFLENRVHAGIPPQEIGFASALQLLDSRSIHPMLSCLEVLDPPGV